MSRKTKRIIMVVALFAAAVLLLVIIGKASSGFTDFENMALRRVNDKNLWQQFTMSGTDGVIVNGSDGVTIKVNDDKQIKINGTAEQTITAVIATGKLAANTSYVFDASLKNGSNGTVYVSVRTADGTNLVDCYRGYVTIPAADTERAVEVVVTIVKGPGNSLTLEPVLSAGSEKADLVSFWK